MSVRRARPVAVAVLALCLVAPSSPSAASHVTWQFEVQRPVHVHEASSLTHAGAAHLWTVEDGVLAHLWESPDGWSTEVVDGAGGPDGRVQAALRNPVTHVYRDQLHVYYVDVQHGHLRHAWWDGVRWRFAVLDGEDVGGSGEGSATARVGADLAAVVHADRPRVFYRTTDEAGTTRLRRARWTGARWTYRTLRVEDEPVQGLTAASGDRLRVWAAVEDGLRHLWWNGRRWREEVIPAAMPSLAYLGRARPVAVVDGQGRPHVVFEGETPNGDVAQEVWLDGTTWRSRTFGVDDSHCPCVPLAGEDGLQVWFNGHYQVNSGEVEMHHARLVDGVWRVERFGGPEPWGQLRAATAAGARVHVWYASYNYPRLWHGWAPARS